MKLASVPGITMVSLRSMEDTTTELLAVVRRLRGEDAARDPALEGAAWQAAELAHKHRAGPHKAGIVAVVEHPRADPAMLVAGVIPVPRPMDPGSAADLRFSLADSGGPGIREVTKAETALGYPVVIIERIQFTGAQLQAVVIDPVNPRIAVFTLHSPTGRGWLELANTTGHLVSTVDFSRTVD